MLYRAMNLANLNKQAQVTWKPAYALNVGLYGTACVPSFKVVLLQS